MLGTIVHVVKAAVRLTPRVLKTAVNVGGWAYAVYDHYRVEKAAEKRQAAKARGSRG